MSPCHNNSHRNNSNNVNQNNNDIITSVSSNIIFSSHHNFFTARVDRQVDAKYSSSKFALSGLSDGFRTAFRRRGVFVTTVNPGLMRTGSPRNAAFKGDAEKEYRWFAPRVGSPVTSISSARAARQVVAAMRHGRARLTITFQARLLHLADTVAPELLADAMALVERYYLPAPVGPEGDRLVMGHDGPEQAAVRDDAGHWTEIVAETARRNNETDAPRP